MEGSSIEEVPLACTLSAAAAPEHERVFRELVTHLRQVHRPSPLHGRFVFAGAGPDDAASSHNVENVENKAREAFGREAQCCAFFAFSFSRGVDETVVVDVTAPAGGEDFVDALAAQLRGWAEGSGLPAWEEA